MGVNTKIIIVAVGVTLALLIGGIILATRPSGKAEMIRNDSHQIASASASVTLVEFGDYQCPACGSYHLVLKQILKDFAGKANFVFRNYPLSGHKNARLAAQAAETAGIQNQFWEMHDTLYENQTAWSNSDRPVEIFTSYAQKLNLDVDKFKTDIFSENILRRINQDVADGNILGMSSTPTFFLNGEQLKNPDSLENFEILIKAALLKAPGKYHIHADFKVYVQGKPVDFSQSPEGDEFIHVHDHNGALIHIHEKGKTLGEFFKSINFDIVGFKLIVNGKAVDDLDNYKPQDLDRILVSDRPDQDQINSVTDTACIYSEKCPERGQPPSEKCVGGLGTNCD